MLPAGPFFCSCMESFHIADVQLKKINCMKKCFSRTSRDEVLIVSTFDILRSLWIRWTKSSYMNISIVLYIRLENSYSKLTNVFFISRNVPIHNVYDRSTSTNNKKNHLIVLCANPILPFWLLSHENGLFALQSSSCYCL